jgi:hypothetical protein
MPDLTDPRRLTAETAAALATSICPACGGRYDDNRHPYAPRITCAWCRERVKLIAQVKRWLSTPASRQG